MVMNQTVHSLNQIIKVKKIHWAQKENKGARLARFGMKKEQEKKKRYARGKKNRVKEKHQSYATCQIIRKPSGNKGGKELNLPFFLYTRQMPDASNQNPIKHQTLNIQTKTT